MVTLLHKMAYVSIGGVLAGEDGCQCEAVGCDGLCRGPYVWWFGIKFVVTNDIHWAMTDYYEHFIPSRMAAKANYLEHGV